MSWYAVDAIDDALDATKAFLFPFSLGRWARLALITLFIGGGGGAGVQNTFQFANSAGQYTGSGGGPGRSSGGSFALAPLFGDGGSPALGTLAQVGPPGPGGLPFALGFVGLLAVAALLLLVLLFTIATPVLQFVFVEAIATDDVRVRGPFKRNFWKGIRLLVFQIAVSVVFAIPIVAVGAAAFFYAEAGPSSNLNVPLIVGAVVLFILWVLLFAVVMGLTTQFVVPVMWVDDSGVLAGWSRVWSLVASEKTQTVVYLLMHLLVGIGVSLVTGLLTLVGLIPVGIVAVAVGLAAGAIVGGTVATNLGVGVGVVAGLAVGLPLYFVFVFLPLNVLTQTYLRTYQLASLAGFDSRYDTLGPYREDDGDGGNATDAPGGGTGGGGVGGHGDRSGGDASGGDGFDEFVPAENLVDDDTDDDGTGGVRDSGTAPVH
ncbi:hypothetical protein HUG10_01735 [Halorarum halophilum]|uniref:Glycerophosphoryl diester phosphodiesterase membrane domain-containing protein n=1 Tax=Halorarum halophilum TaxID=2743090 RepID=A0A7D5K614_9EURY|nr:hypothetical protein [Halobaculum halophilum]QLG26339.1 hypothetical protein HUG10_01735 [Halobaculum halophilum]